LNFQLNPLTVGSTECGFFTKVFKDGGRGSSELGSGVLSRVESPRAKLSLELKFCCLLLLILGSSLFLLDSTYCLPLVLTRILS